MTPTPIDTAGMIALVREVAAPCACERGRREEECGGAPLDRAGSSTERWTRRSARTVASRWPDMPYKDPAKRRKAKCASERRRRAKLAALRGGENRGPVDSENVEPSVAPPPKRRRRGAAVKLRSVVDVRALLEEQIEAVRDTVDGDAIERARAIGYLLQIGLRSDRRRRRRGPTGEARGGHRAGPARDRTIGPPSAGVDHAMKRYERRLSRIEGAMARSSKHRTVAQLLDFLSAVELRDLVKVTEAGDDDATRAIPISSASSMCWRRSSGARIGWSSPAGALRSRATAT
jgi:hypothetical protein